MREGESPYTGSGSALRGQWESPALADVQALRAHLRWKRPPVLLWAAFFLLLAPSLLYTTYRLQHRPRPPAALSRGLVWLVGSWPAAAEEEHVSLFFKSADMWFAGSPLPSPPLCQPHPPSLPPSLPLSLPQLRACLCAGGWVGEGGVGGAALSLWLAIDLLRRYVRPVRLPRHLTPKQRLLLVRPPPSPPPFPTIHCNGTLAGVRGCRRVRRRRARERGRGKGRAGTPRVHPTIIIMKRVRERVPPPGMWRSK